MTENEIVFLSAASDCSDCVLGALPTVPEPRLGPAVIRIGGGEIVERLG